ncbi:MAG TPA: hypothetical protein VF763_08625 [Candidatus Limnocylindrales bacterium]
MAHPFDPRPLLVRHLHGRVCGLAHDFDPAACLLAGAAADDLRSELSADGLALVPLEAVAFLQRAYAELSSDEPIPAVMGFPDGPARELYEARVRIRLRKRDGTLEYGPMQPRWRAEIELVALNHRHGPDIAGAVIEPEAAWVRALLRDVPGLA